MESGARGTKSRTNCISICGHAPRSISKCLVNKHTCCGLGGHSLRQLHLTKHSLPACQRAKNFNKHRYYSANLCTVRLALRTEIRSLRAFFSKALYFAVLVRNL